MGGFHPFARHLGIEMFVALLRIVKVAPYHAGEFRQMAINHQDRFGLVAR